MPTPTPVPFIAASRPYAVPGPAGPIDLDLRANEGLRRESLPVPDDALALARRYPERGPFEALLAARAGRAPEELLVTAGADEGLERICRAFLAPGREALVPVPGFEMTLRFVQATGATLREIPWPDGDFPIAALIAALTPATHVVVLTSPNNPTGETVPLPAIQQIAAAAPQAVVVVDLAYGEYGDGDPAPALRALPNVLIVRTFSKAWGLAGLRLGTIEGPAALVAPCRVAGLPYAVSGPSLAVGAGVLAEGEAPVRAHVARVQAERAAITESLAALGCRPTASRANFAFARTERVGWLTDGLAGLGIAVRGFPGKPGLEDAVRIGCPDDAARLARLLAGLRATLAPEALLFDMDGVLADVSASYRQAILGAAARFGVTLSAEDVEQGKAAGRAANDWELTRRLLAARGVEAPLAEVTAAFEELYQGTPAREGLWRTERLIPPRELLARLGSRLPLAIVTGRPRGDAERFLAHFGLGGLFDAVVTMEEAPGKPSPAPVRLARERLGVSRAWMVGDTPDDVAAARADGVVPLGVLAPGAGETTRQALLRAGAARVLTVLSQLEELLP